MAERAASLPNKDDDDGENSSPQFIAESRVLHFRPSPTSTQGHPYAMVDKRKPSRNPSEETAQPERRDIFNKQMFVTLTIILAIVSVPSSYIVYWAIPDKIKVEMGEQVKADGPLQKLVKHESELTTTKVEELRSQQGKMQDQLTELSVEFKVYFGKQLVNNKVAENAAQRAIDFAGSSQNKREKIAALKIAGNVLERAAANHVVVNYKKVNAQGLALLQQYVDDQKDVVKQTLSSLAKQRTLKFPAPKLPQAGPKYIVGAEKRLDGTLFQDVTFVDCKIIYGDGWLGLENVRFINCTFDVLPENTGKDFYTALFNSEDPIPAVSVRSPGPPPSEKQLRKAEEK